MYAEMKFGVFLCSTCAGLHREINNKVKGLSMCTFNQAELDTLQKYGNLVSLQILLLPALELAKKFDGKVEA
jgi:hypothetical protein